MIRLLPVPALFLALSLALLPPAIPRAEAIAIIWDYTYDSGAFFTPARREVLQSVSAAFADYRIDREALVPGGSNTWAWNFFNPSGSELIELPYLTAEAGELRVFVGARDHGSGRLGTGGNVGWGASGTQLWLDEILSTNTQNAYRPFGGVISFNNTIDWYDGLDPHVTSGKFDLYTVALHELGHVLGVGLYGVVEVWDYWVNTETVSFDGPAAGSIFGGPVPLETDYVHILSGTEYDGQVMVMVPTLPSGTRREWTEVEFGILLDMGYVLIPEPGPVSLLLLAALGIWIIHRKPVPPSFQALAAKRQDSPFHRATTGN